MATTFPIVKEETQHLVKNIEEQMKAIIQNKSFILPSILQLIMNTSCLLDH